LEPAVHHGLIIHTKLSLKAIAIFPSLFTFYCDCKDIAQDHHLFWNIQVGVFFNIYASLGASKEKQQNEIFI